MKVQCWLHNLISTVALVVFAQVCNTELHHSHNQLKLIICTVTTYVQTMKHKCKCVIVGVKESTRMGKMVMYTILKSAYMITFVSLLPPIKKVLPLIFVVQHGVKSTNIQMNNYVPVEICFVISIHNNRLVILN